MLKHHPCLGAWGWRWQGILCPRSVSLSEWLLLCFHEYSRNIAMIEKCWPTSRARIDRIEPASRMTIQNISIHTCLALTQFLDRSLRHNDCFNTLHSCLYDLKAMCLSNWLEQLVTIPCLRWLSFNICQMWAFCLNLIVAVNAAIIWDVSFAK